MVYAALNVILACYAVEAFIGLRNSLVDVWIHGTSLLYQPPSGAGGCSTRLAAPDAAASSRPTGGPCSRATPAAVPVAGAARTAILAAPPAAADGTSAYPAALHVARGDAPPPRRAGGPPSAGCR